MTMDYKLGRIQSPDSRDHKFLMRRKLAAPGTVMPTMKTWAISGQSLDQQSTSCCVGFAWRNFLRCAPVRTEKTGPSAFDIYRGAVTDDEFPANDHEANLPDFDPGLDYGTSVRAGADAVTKKGRLKSYLWTFDLPSTVEWLLTKGPVVAGTDWPTSLFNPDSEGIVKIVGNESAGGHAYLIRGANTKRALLTCENSWGDHWGKRGMFYMPFAVFDVLIHRQGEVCAAIEAQLKPANPNPSPPA